MPSGGYLLRCGAIDDAGNLLWSAPAITYSSGSGGNPLNPTVTWVGTTTEKDGIAAAGGGSVWIGEFQQSSSTSSFHRTFAQIRKRTTAGAIEWTHVANASYTGSYFDEEYTHLAEGLDGSLLVGGTRSTEIAGTNTLNVRPIIRFYYDPSRGSYREIGGYNYNGTSAGSVSGLRKMDDGAFLICELTGNSTLPVRITKLDRFGWQSWSREHAINGFSSEQIADHVSGGYVVLTRGANGVQLLYLDEYGQQVWLRTLAGTSHAPRSLVRTADNGYLVGANRYNADYSDGDYLAIKVDQDGRLEWQGAYGGAGMERLFTAHAEADGGILLFGTSASGISGSKTTPPSGGDDIWIVKLMPAAVAPTIITQPASRNILAGTTATLSVVASGTTASSYQWYQGTSGDISKPITGATASTYVTPVLSTTASFWVRVSNTAGSTFSSTATIGTHEWSGNSAAWYSAVFDSTQQLNAAVSGPQSDPDGDGAANVLEYLLGGDPRIADPRILPTLTASVVGSQKVLVFQYRRKRSSTGVSQIVEHAPHLTGTWVPAVHGVNGVTIQTSSVDTDTEQVTVRIPQSGSSQFVRLRGTL